MAAAIKGMRRGRKPPLIDLIPIRLFCDFVALLVHFRRVKVLFLKRPDGVLAGRTRLNFLSICKKAGQSILYEAFGSPSGPSTSACADYNNWCSGGCCPTLILTL